MKSLNVVQLINSFNKVKNIKKFLKLYLKYKGILIIYNIINRLINLKQFDLLINLPSYVPIFVNSIKVHKNDIYTFILFINLLQIQLNINFNYVINMKYTIDMDFISEYYKLYKCDFIIFIIKTNEFIDINNFDHIVIYDYKTNYLYNILTNSKIYIQNTSCIINSLCFILDKINYAYNINNIITMFKFFQLNNYIKDIIITKHMINPAIINKFNL